MRPVLPFDRARYASLIASADRQDIESNQVEQLALELAEAAGMEDLANAICEASRLRVAANEAREEARTLADWIKASEARRAARRTARNAG